MIDFKYHVVSLISVFLAIALGIIIGTTALNGGIVTNLQSNVSGLKNDKRTLENRVTQLDQALTNNSGFDASVAPQLVNGVLKDQNFVVITAGDAVTAELRDPIIKMMQAAGGKNTGAISLTDGYTDPSHADEMLKYASSDLPAGVNLPESNDPGTVVGSLLAAMIVAPNGGPGQPAAAITTVLSGLGSLGVLKVDSTDIQPASNVVIVTSGAPSSDAKQRNQMLLALASALDKAGANVVIAGDDSAAGAKGLIGAAKADATVATSISTVDNADRASGQVNVVWALKAEDGGTSGAYGARADADPIAPAPK
ncbi:copper transporter [Cumulibacter manganitolerans]|uniref:copper transporter n=1 Tax=Cumulibacter manganitolerans TaxID=1884992 RepID=UPI001296729C|nr:copper transporter [Cumulibacter manganitolerans]